MRATFDLVFIEVEGHVFQRTLEVPLPFVLGLEDVHLHDLARARNAEDVHLLSLFVIDALHIWKFDVDVLQFTQRLDVLILAPVLLDVFFQLVDVV